jgi:glutamate carboxypeptidase
MTSPTTQSLVDGITAWMQCESPTSSPEGLARMVAVMQGYAASAGLQAAVTPLGAAVGPLLHISNRAAGDVRPGLLILGHSDTVHAAGQPLPHRGRPLLWPRRL